jgi:hypothetical protein
VEWDEVLVAFLLCHLTGDFLLQTEWQASNKWGGLGRDPTARRALFSHVLVYGLAFLPALVWLAGDLGMGVIGIAALVLGPHLVQDDGRLLRRYMAVAKHSRVERDQPLYVMVDQSFHAVALFAAALVAA